MRRLVIPVSIVLVTAGVVAFLLRRPEPSARAPRHDRQYAESVQTVFNRRCVVCHACFDSPCQLNLQSFEGVDRGANSRRVYDPGRIEGAPPTRMFEDARSTEEWQTRFGFFPVVSRIDPEQGSLHDSLLYHMITQRRDVPRGGSYDVDAPQTCPRNVAALDLVLRARPERGMPFGLPPLTDDELRPIVQWIEHGAAGTSAELWNESDATRAEIADWEAGRAI